MSTGKKTLIWIGIILSAYLLSACVPPVEGPCTTVTLDQSGQATDIDVGDGGDSLGPPETERGVRSIPGILEGAG